MFKQLFLWSLMSVTIVALECVEEPGISCTVNSLMYVGSYTDAISWYTVSNEGSLSYVNKFSDPTISNPSWLTISNSKQFMYAVSEVDDFEGYSGAIVALRIDPVTHGLKILNKVSSHGAAPCHLTLSPDDSFLYASNYCSGTLSVFEIMSDGRLSNATQVIDHSVGVTTDCSGAHVHESVLDGNRMFVNDLGLDQIFQYDWNPLTQQLETPQRVTETIQLAGGSGPRHLIIHPQLNYAFVVAELDSTVTSLSYTRRTTHSLAVLSTASTLAPGVSNQDMGAAEIQISADGRFVYISNRDISENPNQNRSSVSVFAVDEGSGALTLVQCMPSMGVHPRHFTLALEDRFLLVANKDSDNVVTFARDSTTGMLSNGLPFYSEHMIQPTQVLIVQ